MGVAPATMDVAVSNKKIITLSEGHQQLIEGHGHGEGSMARGQLARTAEQAIMILNMISDDTDLEEWVESKITKSQDYLSSVLNYMKGKAMTENKMKITRSRLKQIIKEEMGLVQARTTTDPTLDQIESIAKTVVETNPEGGLMAIATALQDEGLDTVQKKDKKKDLDDLDLKSAKVMSGVLFIEETNGNKYFIGNRNKFDIEPGEEVISIGEPEKYVLGVME